MEESRNGVFTIEPGRQADQTIMVIIAAGKNVEVLTVER